MQRPTKAEEVLNHITGSRSEARIFIAKTQSNRRMRGNKPDVHCEQRVSSLRDMCIVKRTGRALVVFLEPINGQTSLAVDGIADIMCNMDARHDARARRV